MIAGIATCVALAAALVVRQRGRGILGLHAAVLLVLALGPAVAHLRGQEIYAGIVTEHIVTAVHGFALALAGLLLAELMVPQRRYVAALVDPIRPRRWSASLSVLLVPMTAYALVVIARLGPGAHGLDKTARIAAAGGGHYVFLSLSLPVLAAWPLVRPSRSARWLYAAFLVSYVAYCVTTQERDFVFVLLALVFLGRLTSAGSRFTPVLAVGGLATLAVTTLSSGRGGSTEQSSALFQGSLLFVDTRIDEYVPGTTPRQHGVTYLDALTSALTRGHVGGSSSPTQWLVDLYAPGTGAGYGFSMSGEAVLNFGMVGVLPVFLVVGVVVNLAVNRVDRSAFSAHLAYFLAMFVPYMFRSDSRGLLSGVVTCAVLHVGLSLVARPPETQREVRRHAAARDHRGATVPRP